MATKTRSKAKNDSQNQPETLQETIADEVAEHEATMVGNEQLEPAAPKVVKNETTVFNKEREVGLSGDHQMIPFNKLERRDNVRTKATLRLEEMVQSFTQRGFKKNHPLVVSKKPSGKFLVLCGNRRTEALEVIEEQNPTLFATILPDGMIPAIVHENLTEEEEILIRIDHSEAEDRVPLDEWGEFLAVKQLVRVGYDTQADIAAKLGKFDKDGNPKRPWVQPRVNLARMPQYVQDEMQKLCEKGPESTPLRWNNIPTLYKLYGEDFKKGYRDGGPKFKEAWEKLLNPPVDPDAPGGKPSVMSGTKMKEQAKAVGSRVMARTLLKAAGEPTDVSPEDGKPYIADWTEIEADAVQCEAAMQQITDLADMLGQEEFNELTKKVREFVETRDQKQGAA